MAKVARVFRPHEAGLRKILGGLEADVMEMVWESKEATVRDIYEKLRLRRKIAYTTVMTTMSHLSRKGLLRQERSGTAYSYRPALTREDFGRRVAGEVLSGLFSGFMEPVLSNVSGSEVNLDQGTISALQAIVQDRSEGGKDPGESGEEAVPARLRSSSP
ncbi:MAG: BlaI/MecI/CopY family transcriptional regulator [Firmicutes bacterium]|nr:BlaI/MecI/CopY family transcriptional regulator [Bacillota bacterium]